MVADAKAKTSDKRWLSAIDRASEAILNGDLIVTTLANGALVTSPNGSYFVNGHCECKAAQRAHRECYYRAAARLVELMEMETLSVTTKVTEESEREGLISSIKSAWSAKFPGLSLADELMARFKKNSLEMLSPDFLVAIKAVIA